MTETQEAVKEKIAQFTEFESKYRVDGDMIYKFKEIVEALNEPYEFLYVQGPDHWIGKHIFIHNNK